MFLEDAIKKEGKSTDYIIFGDKNSVIVDIKTIDLFLAQYIDENFNAVDTVVKYLAVENYYGKNDFGFELYRKMQNARINENWDERFKQLILNFENGYDKNFCIETDVDYSIHDGSHRLALGLYHGIDMLSTKIFNIKKTRRNYMIGWFEKNGFTNSEINIIMECMTRLLDQNTPEFYCLLWPPTFCCSDEIIENIKQIKSVEISDVNKYKLTQQQLVELIYEVYETDDISIDKLDLKCRYMLNSITACNLDKEELPLVVLKLKIKNPNYKLKHLSGKPQSIETIEIKKRIRNEFKEKINKYYYDIIMHVTDNELQNDQVQKILTRRLDKNGK